MPHLAPLNWLLLPLFFFLTLLLLLSTIWWTQLISVPNLKTKQKNSMSSWKWN
uniref:ATP synthase F0 subunit 8 n=1 Tax=Riftia pachyptila TaxID=6426 RepID=Q642V5_RIFPA|nr:ATP synthase F0 subunit 8 [Riftia pachyptila]AAU20753.1 ATPase F0 subunit 8 [Riftia pachyptila]AIL54850.1 ATP synthase F0 subunit 8 [Riftia pachyptila]WAB69329.1 ATP synthase F0 subunit 8 [Riftia pachyptila]WLD05568.1 ATP synthase F0 subunit 8 [Riftia pachyptila]